ncbi:TonB-dependent receptor [Sphingobium sufflavum]|uniref:TonB-dependent receptor n=1 Tax=Sphingobium sufflavum TaxID=1129547 RepID=UPI001F3E574C|nr:TonB-dependent receptor [Sphingobium sufflavum]MCE7797224.1 TonB-dependent receptor [Sphingobium sufflavum]
MNSLVRRRIALVASTVLATGVATPAWSQSSDPSDIIVTARRVEERLQDVPISITVLNQEQLTNNNVQNAKDLATYTPGLTLNARYGADNTTFTIRGFTQEQRTTSTVGTYFADVVAPRGSGASPGGDGAGPGQLFDLQNVQVLKGPQGTLQGRNSTGGAVLIVPRKPTGKLEGYVEGSIGDYDLRRVQAVVNVPVNDTLRVRVGVDRSTRDGYLKNAGRIGFGSQGDAGGSQDYIALRASVVADLAPNLENYTIVTYAKSKSTGTTPKITRAFTSRGGTAQQAQIDRENAFGDFWTVSNSMNDALSQTTTWQAINTTTWQASDTLTVKNIASYAEFRGKNNIDLFGVYTPVGVPAGTETNPYQVRNFTGTHVIDGRNTNAESTFVEEIQFQGRPSDRLIWQGGLYFESSQPLGQSGTQSATFTPCVNIATFNCVTNDGGATSLGRQTYSTTLTKYRGIAAYGQASYDITDKLKFTAGLRYTWDKMSSAFQVVDINLNGALPPAQAVPPAGISPVPAGFSAACAALPTFGIKGSATNPYQPIANRFDMCKQFQSVSTEAPTWLIDLDYKVAEDVLLYAKWSRGYRQGGVNPFGADKLQSYGKEKVNTYEVGAKASWRGSFPGHFNVSGYYNDFSNQQIQLGLQCVATVLEPTKSCTQTTAILNVGKSELYGAEVELGISPFQGLQLNVAYAYIKTRILEVQDASSLITSNGLPYNDIRPPAVGDPIPAATPHKWNISGSYTLPLPESVGKISVGGTYVYQSSTLVSQNSCYPGRFGMDGSTTAKTCVVTDGGILPGYGVANLSVNWEGIAGSALDAGFFMTNITNQKYYISANDQGQTSGFISNIIGEPRMYGFRLKYRFGG